MNIFKKWLKNDWKNAEILRIETFSEHCNILILNASHDTSSNYLKKFDRDKGHRAYNFHSALIIFLALFQRKEF